MREILFRGKRIDNGEWVYGCLVHGVFFKAKDNSDIPYVFNIDDVDYDDFEDFAEGRGYYEVYPETVGQYTGLTDKNGKKIFEGDILDYFGISYVVSWSKELLTYIVTSVNEKKEYLFYLNKANMDKVYVIGNIHDNPELLEVGE